VCEGRGAVGGVGVWGHSLRSTFHRLHLLRLWTPTILVFNTILYKNEFQNPQVFHQHVRFSPERSTLVSNNTLP
jgi:hypothetical protein